MGGGAEEEEGAGERVVLVLGLREGSRAQGEEVFC